MSDRPNGLTYAQAGVDIDAGNAMVEKIKPLVRSTRRPGADGEIGGFGGLFDLKAAGFADPVLVAANDGVGTKVKVAIESGIHGTVGIDLVAMCVNDLVVQGAEPLFFLDYFATGHLDVDTAADVIKGIAAGCEQAGCALIGGETAEMPGMYQGGDYDLAGFAVGVVEKSKIIDGSKVKTGDALIGLASSGPHSNGYSLVRKVIEVSKAYLGEEFHGKTLGETLLAPTRIYIKPLLQLFAQVDVHALAHITGGGLLENIPRVLPENCRAVIDGKSWRRPPVFDWLQQKGNIAEREMHRVFNCGVGMVIAVAQEDLARSLELLRAAGETAWHLGAIDTVAVGGEQVVINT